MNDPKDYKGDKTQDFTDDVKALCKQYGLKLISITVNEIQRND